MPNTDEKITELLLQWEESSEHGAEVSIDELCRDCPELAEVVTQKIDALKEMAWVTKDDDSPDDVDDDIPRTLAGRYQLTERIAVGGFGQVWKAFDPELERQVAIKIPKRLNGQSTDSFLDEARKVASLKHPGIVTVHDVGKENGYTFIVSDLIDGTDLAQKIRNDRPSMSEAVRLVAQAAEHLHFAHEQGFVHRDVKPANILLDQSGKVFIADFGIAVTKDDSRKNSGSQGTLAYMAPEQLAGENHLVDARTDVYALGVVLFELLTGQHPFTATTPLAMREQILFRQPTPLRKVDSSIPSELDAICLKCLSKHPADRYGTAHDLSVELQNIEKSLPFKRFRAVAGVLLIVAAIFAGGAYGISFFPSSTNEPKKSSDSTPSIQMVKNGALHFDGRTRIVTPVKQFLPVTLEAWIRTNDLHTMFLIGSDLPDKFGIGLQINRLIVSAEIVSGGVHAPKPIQPNQWCHMAVVLGNSHTTLYVNGKPVARGQASKLSGDTPFVIGNLGEDHLSQFYNGQIRSVRISKGERYTTEFVPDDVLQSNSTAVLVYDASSVRGSRVVDLSGKNNHGSIQRLLIENVRANNATTPPQFHVIVADGFDDKTRKNGIDAKDVDWFLSIPQWKVRISDDPIIGNGAALTIPVSSASTKAGFVSASFKRQELGSNRGDLIRLKFDFRLEGNLETLNTSVRFGLFDSNGTPITKDDFFNSGELDDHGYTASFGVGTKETLSVSWDKASPLGGPGVVQLTTEPTEVPTSITNPNQRHSATLTLERITGQSVQISASIDGSSVSAVHSRRNKQWEFDEIAIKCGRVSNAPINLVIDNVLVETITHR